MRLFCLHDLYFIDVQFNYLIKHDHNALKDILYKIIKNYHL